MHIDAPQLIDATPLLADANLNIHFNNLELKVNEIFHDLPNPYRHYIEHYHHDYEIRFLESGCEHLRVNGSDFVVREGDMYILPPKSIHRRRSDLKLPATEICIRISIFLKPTGENDAEREKSPLEQEEQLFCQFLTFPSSHVFKASPALSGIFYGIVDCHKNKQPGYLLMGQALLLQFMVEVYRIVATHCNLNERYPARKKLRNEERLEDIVRFVELNYNNNATIRDLERILHISGRQINRIVKKHMGVTFCEYFSKFKLETAQNLLLTTDMSIEDIAFASGFTNTQQMYRRFKACKNLSATQIRGGKALPTGDAAKERQR